MATKDTYIEDVELEAFRLIRHKCRDILNPSTDAEVGSYVKGVVDLESALYGSYLKSRNACCTIADED